MSKMSQKSFILKNVTGLDTVLEWYQEPTSPSHPILICLQLSMAWINKRRPHENNNIHLGGSSWKNKVIISKISKANLFLRLKRLCPWLLPAEQYMFIHKITQQFAFHFLITSPYKLSFAPNQTRGACTIMSVNVAPSLLRVCKLLMSKWFICPPVTNH